MQQLSRTCQVLGHYFKAIEYVCVYPQCEMSRFLCSKCALGIDHKHNRSDNSHLMDNMDFQERVKNNLHKMKGKQQQQKYDIEKSIVPLKQLMQEIQNLLKNIQNFIQQVEQGKLQNNIIDHLEDQLLNVQKYGFNQIDDQSLNNLINIPEQQQDLDIYKQLEDQANLIIQNALNIREWRSQQDNNSEVHLFLKQPLNNIINMPEQQQDLDIYKCLEDQANQQQDLDIYKQFEDQANLIIQNKDHNSEEHQFLKTGKNVFIIGYQLSGKSTLANALKDRESLFFEKEGQQYTPVSQYFFPIFSDDYDGRKQPKSFIIQDQQIQIWDFPGYGMLEDHTQQIVNRIQQISIINKSFLTHIIIVLPYCQFIHDRGQNIIQILNLFDQNDLPASLIISKASKKVRSMQIIEKLQNQLGQNEIIYNNEAKDFLKQIIDHYRIQFFYQPVFTKDNQFQFQEDNIQQIKQLVFDKKFYHDVKLKIKYFASDQLRVNVLGSQFLMKYNEICNQFIEIFIRNIYHIFYLQNQMKKKNN